MYTTPVSIPKSHFRWKEEFHQANQRGKVKQTKTYGSGFRGLEFKMSSLSFRAYQIG